MTNKIRVYSGDLLVCEGELKDIAMPKKDIVAFFSNNISKEFDTRNNDVTIEVVGYGKVTMPKPVFIATMKTKSHEHLDSDIVSISNGLTAKMSEISGYGKNNISFNRVFGGEVDKENETYTIGKYKMNFIAFEGLRNSSPTKWLKLLTGVTKSHAVKAGSRW